MFSGNQRVNWLGGRRSRDCCLNAANRVLLQMFGCGVRTTRPLGGFFFDADPVVTLFRRHGTEIRDLDQARAMMMNWP